MFSDREAPLYEIKANLFKGLAHPARIRILEILAESPSQSCPVSELLGGTGLEPSHLSQHLATLRRHRVVTSVRTANSVTYSLAHPKIAELPKGRSASGPESSQHFGPLRSEKRQPRPEI